MKINKKTESDKILDIATKRGFIYPSAEIYGSKAGFWTYGSLGTRIKHKWENIWRSYFLGLSNNFYEIEDCNILPKQVFKSSGHLDNFNDPLTQCEKCNFRFKADQLVEGELDKRKAVAEDENFGEILEKGLGGKNVIELGKLIKHYEIKCPNCKGNLSDVKFFNMMFDVKVGATSDDIMYLRPESAQSPYLAFKREFEATRRKLPLGLASVGHVFRNEISPRQGFFRLREFNQAELQIFFDPEKINEHNNWGEVKNYKLLILKNNKITKISCSELNKLKIPKFYVYHMAKVQKFYLDVLMIPENLFRFRELDSKERAFYNKIHFDIELNLDTLGGWKEAGGVHYRSDHDLGGHQLGSNEKLEVTIDENNKVNKFIPHVLELSFGVDRNIWALLDIFFKEEKERTLFSFPSLVLPIDIAVFPLMNKDGIPEFSEKFFDNLSKIKSFNFFYDDSGSIGKRYRRQDEIGTKLCITIDHDSLKDNCVTIRDRDSMKQVRVHIGKIEGILHLVLRIGDKLEDVAK